MKRKLLKVTLALMATAWVGGVQAQESPNFGGQVTVSTETVWVFNDETADGEVLNVTEKNNLYYRAKNATGGGFTFADASQSLTFSDGYVVNVTKVAKFNDNNSKGMTEIYAGTTGSKTFTGESSAMTNYSFPCFAFNASVAGTCYAYVKGGAKSSNAKAMKVYFGKGDGTALVSGGTSGGHNTLQEMKYTSTSAGTFFIAGTAAVDESTPYEVYAIRFVPTEGKADKIVYIGATGYATYGSVDNTSYTLPAGLKAYGAKASADNHSVELTESTTGIKKTKAYILKGAPKTNYRLTKNDGTTSDPTNSTLERANVTVTFSVDGNGYDSSTGKYYYILAADGDVAKFFAVANGSNLAKGKAYLQTDAQLTPADAGSRGVSIIFADEATGIEAVTTQQGDGQWYNLQGQKVAQPAKGLFIKNGKKVIIK